MVVMTLYDLDAHWLLSEYKRANTVGEIISRCDQFENKLHGLKYRYQENHSIHIFAMEFESVLEKLKRKKWNELLVDNYSGELNKYSLSFKNNASITQ